MILNVGSGGGSSGGLKVIAWRQLYGGLRQPIHPAGSGSVCAGRRIYAGFNGRSAVLRNVAILAPGMIARGLNPEVTFESDAVTLTMGSTMSSTVTRNYIAFG